MPDQPISKPAHPSNSDNFTPDPRHLRRMKVVQQLFAATFDNPLPPTQTLPFDQTPEIQQIVKQIISQLDQIDPLLQQHAPERPLDGINQVDLAILRLIVWEEQTQKTPKKVLIDEAVELAKEFGSDSSPRFVNGVLGKLLLNN